VLAKGEDVSVMKIDDSGELGGKGQGTTRSDDGDENLWHEELHERRVHHQSEKERMKDPSPVTRGSTASKAETEAAALVLSLEEWRCVHARAKGTDRSTYTA
jgi:hypothetical protein